jgi:hypothetical protein
MKIRTMKQARRVALATWLVGAACVFLLASRVGQISQILTGVLALVLAICAYTTGYIDKQTGWRERERR